MREIYHEMPLAMLKEGYEEKLTSGHYALVHLWDEYPEAYDHAVNALKAGRPFILDNSIFELEVSFDPDRFAHSVSMLAEASENENFYYIVPDVLDDMEGTIESARSFLGKYPHLPGKAMAVAQGTTEDELRECILTLQGMEPIEKLGISFNCEAYNRMYDDALHGRKYGERVFNIAELIGAIDHKIPPAYLVGWSTGRAVFVENIFSEIEKPLHLLGCSLPQEFRMYDGLDLIESVDTSNPIIHGLHGVGYGEYGLSEKISLKLADMFEKPMGEITPFLPEIEYNVKRFRQFVNGVAQ